MTNDNTPAIVGTAEAGSTVAITISGVTYTGVADGSGNYSITVPTSLADGSYSASITATDAAGNTSTATTVNFDVDTAVPSVPTGVATPNVTSGATVVTFTGTMSGDTYTIS